MFTMHELLPLSRKPRYKSILKCFIFSFNKKNKKKIKKLKKIARHQKQNIKKQTVIQL